MTEQVMRLLRDGTSVGLHLVVSGDRSLVTGRMSTLVENRVVLRLADRGDYSVVGVPTREVPDTLPDGRALTPTPSWRGRSPCSPRTSPAPARTRPCARSPAATRSATPRPRGAAALPARGGSRLAAARRRAARPGGRGGRRRDAGVDPARRGRRRPPAAGPRPVRDPGRAGGRTAEVGRTNLRFAVRAALDAGRPVLGLCPVDNALWRDLDLHGAGLRTDGLAQEEARRPAPGAGGGHARRRRRRRPAQGGAARARCSRWCSRPAARAGGSWSPGRPRRSAAGTAAGCTSCARPGRACCSPRRA